MGIHPRLSLPVPKHQNQLEVTAEYEDATGRKIEETFVVDFAAFENLSRVGEAPLHTIAKSIEKLQKSIGNLSSGTNKLSVHYAIAPGVLILLPSTSTIAPVAASPRLTQ